MMFKVLLIGKMNNQFLIELVDFDEVNLMDGDVLVQVEYFMFNYKDVFVFIGKSLVIWMFLLIFGIDLVGVVLEFSRVDFMLGDCVVFNGWDLSMGYYGGLVQCVCVCGEWFNWIFGNLSICDVMVIGIVGYIVMLCVLVLEYVGVMFDKGDVLVIGVNGGVGLIVVVILLKLGYCVVVVIGCLEYVDYLYNLGVVEIIDCVQFFELCEWLVSVE